MSLPSVLRALVLRLKVRLKDKPCIRLIQENLIEFQVQSVYLIYTS